MILLIGGESHTGKTLMAQRLLEKYHFPYTSLDHIKMGLFRGYKNCGFTPLDGDDIISEKLWGVVDGMITTAHENGQNLILEGCYLPPGQVRQIICEDIIAVYLVFSKSYIDKSFDYMLTCENIIETRKFPEERDKEAFIAQNARMKNACIAADLPYFEIQTDYEKEISDVYQFIHHKVLRFRPYTSSDLEQIAALFYNTVHTVCAKDYSPAQLDAWANGRIDETAFDRSLLAHDTVIAEIGGKVVGFGDMDKDYLDRLYVHHHYQAQGIGAAIVEQLEQHAFAGGAVSISTHASITARPFFQRLGYHIQKEQHLERNGQILTNYVMQK